MRTTSIITGTRREWLGKMKFVLARCRFLQSVVSRFPRIRTKITQHRERFSTFSAGTCASTDGKLLIKLPRRIKQLLTLQATELIRPTITIRQDQSDRFAQHRSTGLGELSQSLSSPKGLHQVDSGSVGNALANGRYVGHPRQDNADGEGSVFQSTRGRRLVSQMC